MTKTVIINKKSKEILQELKKAGITIKEIFKARKEIIDFVIEEKEFPKTNKKEIERFKVLNDYYKNKYEEKPDFTEKISAYSVKDLF